MCPFGCICIRLGGSRIQASITIRPLLPWVLEHLRVFFAAVLTNPLIKGLMGALLADCFDG